VRQETYSGFAETGALEGHGVVGIREREVLVLAVLGVKTMRLGEGDHIGGVQSVLGVVQREGGDAGLVGMGSHVSLGNLAGHPHGAQLVLTLADDLHDPAIKNTKRIANMRNNLKCIQRQC